MRLHEIDDFRRNLDELFDIAGNVITNKDGSISIDGDVTGMRSSLTKLPIQFDTIRGMFACGATKLTSLKGCPKIVGYDFYCDSTEIESLEGGPKKVGRDYHCQNITTLKSLIGLPKSIDGSITLTFLSDLPLLRLLFVEGLKHIHFYDIKEGMPTAELLKLSEILEKYIGQGRRGAIQCAAEMSQAGYRNNARL